MGNVAPIASTTQGAYMVVMMVRVCETKYLVCVHQNSTTHVDIQPAKWKMTVLDLDLGIFLCAYHKQRMYLVECRK